MMRTILYALVFTCVLCLLQGCASELVQQTTVKPIPFSSRDEITNKLIDHYEQWYGTPYRSGGMSKNGIDCSGFIQVTYGQLFGLQLPRTTVNLARSGSQIPASDLQPGDLVLFKTSWKDNHVGIYLAENKFMHASTSRGVMLSGLYETYWKKHFWQARRIFN